MSWRVMVANRGEIAVRVILACKELGMHSVALYSDADKGSLAVRLADEAYRLGPTPARLSYMDAKRIVDLAVEAKVDAIHPGYGFLAESPALARLCREAGIAFVGPSEEVLEASGDKMESKRRAVAAGLSVLDWADPSESSPDALVDRVSQMGLPVLVKAAAGGGGRGQKVIENIGDLLPAIGEVRRQAAQIWGDDRVFVEKMVAGGRHVEVQVLADGQGSVVHLGTRDCSVQRNRQKFLEEAPAQGLDEALRDRLGWAAAELARHLQYRGAGTVEFLVDGQGGWWFLEMNPRIQVEHTVTEAVTGVDLVKAQLRIARGEHLWITQDQIHLRGHAIQARLYAEAPSEGFSSSSGQLHRFRIPEGPHVRVDSGYETGDEVPAAYDPLLAKVTVWGEDRGEALVRMDEALRRLVVLGVETNAGLLANILRDADFRRGGVSTTYLEEHRQRLVSEKLRPEVVAAWLAGESDTASVQQVQAEWDKASPWEVLSGWRNGPNGVGNSAQFDQVRLRVSGKVETVGWRQMGDLLYAVVIGDRATRVALTPVAPGTFHVRTNGRASLVHRHEDSDGVWVSFRGRTYRIEKVAEEESRERARPKRLQQRRASETNQPLAHPPGTVVAPASAHVVAVPVSEGQVVEQGQVVAVLEAMKLELLVRADVTGRVRRLLAKVGQPVRRGEAVAELAPMSN